VSKLLKEAAVDDTDQPAAAGTPSHPGIEALIERWWEDHFPGSAVARDTQAWNIAHAAKEALKRLLARADEQQRGN
jgi:hypothetical protein